MNSQDFARDLHSRKCQRIAAGFVGESNGSTEIQKGSVEESLVYMRHQKAVHSNNLLQKVGEDTVHRLSDAVNMTEEVFLKAVDDQSLEVYDLPTLNKFKSDLIKAAANGLATGDDIEKAKKDLGKLTKVQVSDKNGQKRTVWVKRGGDEESSQGKPKKVAYASETKTKEEGDHIISRAKAALENPKTPMSMRTKAQEMIDHETKKWSKEHEAHADYSNEKHPHHEAFKSGQAAAKEGAVTHAYDKNSEQGKAKAEAWEAGHKSAGGGKKPEKPEYDKELEDLYDKKTGGGGEEAKKEEKPAEKPKAEKPAEKKPVEKPKPASHEDIDKHIEAKGKPNMKNMNTFSHREHVAKLAELMGDHEGAKHIREKAPKDMLHAYEKGFEKQHGDNKKTKEKEAIQKQIEQDSAKVAKKGKFHYDRDDSRSLKDDPRGKQIIDHLSKPEGWKQVQGVIGRPMKSLGKGGIYAESTISSDIRFWKKSSNPDDYGWKAVNPDDALKLYGDSPKKDTSKTNPTPEQAQKNHDEAVMRGATERSKHLSPTGDQINKPKVEPKKEEAKTPERNLKGHLSDKKGWERNKEYDMDAKHVGEGIHAFKTEDGDIVYISNPGKANEKEHTEEEAHAAYEKEKGKAKEIVGKYKKDGSEKESKMHSAPGKHSNPSQGKWSSNQND